MTPESFPRIPHLVQGAMDDDDLLVPADLRDTFFGTPVLVEETVDGSNVMIFRTDYGYFDVAGRAGVGAQDRAGQLGPLRAWVANNHQRLDALLGDTEVLYAEWLWLEHSLPYDRLPDHLIVLDLWTPERGFVRVEERDRRAQEWSFFTAPVLARDHILRSPADLEELAGTSRFTDARMEGLILRVEDELGLADRAKWVRPDFQRKPDSEWRAPFARNRLIGEQPSGD